MNLLQPLGDGAPRHPIQLGVQSQVLLGRQVAVERGVLEHESDVAPHLVVFEHHVVPGHEGRCPRWA